MPAAKKVSEKLTELPAGQPSVSFEFFPPKTDDGVKNLLARAERMAKQDPLFMDMTWGAGGSSSELTLDLCTKIQQSTGIEMNMHLTCTNMEAEKVDIALEGCKAADIRNILALRGDPPAGQEQWEVTEGGFSCALDLVKYIVAKYGDYFCITVAGYPEGHPNVITEVADESKLSEAEKGRLVVTKDGGKFVCHDEDYKKEMAYLKEKVDAGASAIVTQMVFDADVYIQFVKDCRAIGIDVPILPGIMCVQNKGGFERMTAFCKSRVPPVFAETLAPLDESDKGAIKDAMTTLAVDLCRKLLAGGAPGVHLYCLNLEKVAMGILEGLGLLKEEAEKVAATN